MKAERYLVLIHFAAKVTRNNLAEVALQVARSIRSNLHNSETITSSSSSVAFVGDSATSADSLFRALAPDLRPGDNLSIFALGRDIATSHQGLDEWNSGRKRNQTPAK